MFVLDIMFWDLVSECVFIFFELQKMILMSLKVESVQKVLRITILLCFLFIYLERKRIILLRQKPVLLY